MQRPIQFPIHLLHVRRLSVGVAAALAIAACAGGSTPSATPTDTTGRTSPATTDSVSTVSDAPTDPPTDRPTDPEPSIATATDAEDAVGDMMDDYLAFLGAAVDTGSADTALLEQVIGHYAAQHVTIDAASAAGCYEAAVGPIRGNLFEHSYRLDSVAITLDIPGDAPIWATSFLDNQVSIGRFDAGQIRQFVVTPDGIIGSRTIIDKSGVADCIEQFAIRTDVAEQWFGASTQAGGLENDDSVEGRLVGARSSGPDAGADDRAGADGESDSYPRRPGFAPDPNDPEPIASTGSNKWDIITDDDPSAFACLVDLGRGPAEILDRKKEQYEMVPDSHLFRAEFHDGSHVQIRVHPEVGDEAAVRAEAERYLVPLGQLPSSLRAGIERFAVRSGDETATASAGEGISVQIENMNVRESDGRLAETLFHEAVHRTFDSTYSYQRSPEWMAAQAADGKWLTEYGRENPDNEDLAESMLYAYAVLQHPGRLEPAVEASIKERIPNRIEFIAGVLPPGQPATASAASACPPS